MDTGSEGMGVGRPPRQRGSRIGVPFGTERLASYYCSRSSCMRATDATEVSPGEHSLH